MEFLATLEPDEDGWIATFPAVPEVVAGAHSREAVIDMARDQLEIALLTYLKDGRTIPQSDTDVSIKPSEARIGPSASAAAKMAFIEAFNASGLTRVALAERLGKAETEVRRMLDFYHPTKLPALEEALRALGKQLVVSVREAA